MKYLEFSLSVLIIGWLIVCCGSTPVRARTVDLKIVNEKILPSGNRKVSEVFKTDSNNEKFLRNEKNVNIQQDPDNLAIVFGVGKLKSFDENFKNAVKKQDVQSTGDDLTKKVPWYDFDKLRVKWDTIAPFYEMVMSITKNKNLHKGIGIIRNSIKKLGTLLKDFVIDMLDPLPQYIEEEMNYEKWNIRGLYNALNLYAMIKGAMINHYFNKMQKIANVFFKNAAITKKYFVTIISRIQEVSLFE